METKREITWYDCERQCWVVNAIVQRCGHPEAMACNCYGRKHAGEVLTLVPVGPTDGRLREASNALALIDSLEDSLTRWRRTLAERKNVQLQKKIREKITGGES